LAIAKPRVQFQVRHSDEGKYSRQIVANSHKERIGRVDRCCSPEIAVYNAFFDYQPSDAGNDCLMSPTKRLSLGLIAGAARGLFPGERVAPLEILADDFLPGRRESKRSSGNHSRRLMKELTTSIHAAGCALLFSSILELTGAAQTRELLPVPDIPGYRTLKLTARLPLPLVVRR
jgi:hypothetical protein